MNEDDLFAPYVKPDPDSHPADIAARLLELEEFAHLVEGEASIDWLLRTAPKVKAGREILGTCYLPSVQGDLKDLFEWMLAMLLGRMPDFLVVLDQDYWLKVDDRLREILVYHEMLHMGHAVDRYGAPRYNKETGMPVFCIVGHDVEEFTATVRRYGAYSEDIRRFIAAAGADMSQGDVF